VIEPAARAEPPRAPETAAAPPAWLDAALSWPLLTQAPLRSQHLGRAHLAELRVSPEAVGAYRSLTPDTELPPGSFFVEWLRDAESGRPGPIFALERAPEGWRFWVLDARGQPEPGGAPGLCAGCHAGAPAPPLFGLPREGLESTAPVPRSPE